MKFGIEFDVDVKKAEKQVKDFLETTRRETQKAMRDAGAKVSSNFGDAYVSPEMKRAFPMASQEAFNVFQQGQTRRKNVEIKRQVIDPFTGNPVEVGTGRFTKKDVLNTRYQGLSQVDQFKVFSQRQERAAELRALRGAVGGASARNFINPLSGGIDWKGVAEQGSSAATPPPLPPEVKKPIKEFGKEVSIATGGLKTFAKQLGGIALMYMGAKSLAGFASDVLHAGQHKEQIGFKNSIAFGSRQNAMKTYKGLLKKSGPFEVEDTMSGMSAMENLGVSGKGSYDMIGNMAGRLGGSYSDTASDIAAAIGGDSSVLMKYGLKQQDLMGLRHLQGGTPRMKSAVMGLLNRSDIKKKFEGGMEDFANSWEGTMNKLKNQRQTLFGAILGDVSDPNSLYGRVKGTFTKITKWFDDNKLLIQRAASFIGKTVTWVWGKIEHIASKIGKSMKGLMEFFFNSEKDFVRFTKRFLFSMEYVSNRIAKLFEFPFATLAAGFGAAFLGKQAIGFFTGVGKTYGKSMLKGLSAVLLGFDAADMLDQKIRELKYGSEEEVSEGLKKSKSQSADAQKTARNNWFEANGTKYLSAMERVAAYFDPRGISAVQNSLKVRQRAMLDKDLPQETRDMLFGGKGSTNITINIDGSVLVPEVVPYIVSEVENATNKARKKQGN